MASLTVDERQLVNAVRRTIDDALSPCDPSIPALLAIIDRLTADEPFFLEGLGSRQREVGLQVLGSLPRSRQDQSTMDEVRDLVVEEDPSMVEAAFKAVRREGLVAYPSSIRRWIRAHEPRELNQSHDPPSSGQAFGSFQKSEGDAIKEAMRKRR